MNSIKTNPYTVNNQIAIRNPAFTIVAQGSSADRIAIAAAFAIGCIGVAAIIKALR
jgi:hypothetical protein